MLLSSLLSWEFPVAGPTKISQEGNIFFNQVLKTVLGQEWKEGKVEIHGFFVIVVINNVLKGG